jgi:hypothetical protein
VTGTFAKPRFAPDAARVAEMKLKNVLPSTGSAGGIVSGILGRAVAGRQEQPPAAAETKRKGILGVLERLGETARPPQSTPEKPQ